MEATTALQPLTGNLTGPHKPAFKVFIACESQAAFFEAIKVRDEVKGLCAGEANICSVSWNFALLRDEQIREHALRDAAEADMIVLSFSGSTGLPSYIEDWLESWPFRPQGSEGALVILTAVEAECRAEWARHLAYLRRLAESRGLEFFCNQDGWERLGFSKPPISRLGGWFAPEEILADYIQDDGLEVNN